jgi:hypothetical protein
LSFPKAAKAAWTPRTKSVPQEPGAQRVKPGDLPVLPLTKIELTINIRGQGARHLDAGHIVGVPSK